MSRKLDALFAERVLGKQTICIHEDLPDYRNWFMADTRHEPVEQVPRYTTSLDAAWEGVGRWERNHFSLTWLAVGWEARIVGAGVSAVAQTPALAVVKACLMACGVTEQEVEEAEG